MSDKLVATTEPGEYLVLCFAQPPDHYRKQRRQRRSLLYHAGKYRLDIKYRRPVKRLKRVDSQPAPALNLFDDQPMETDRIWAVRRTRRKDSSQRAARFSSRSHLQEIAPALIEPSKNQDLILCCQPIKSIRKNRIND